MNSDPFRTVTFYVAALVSITLLPAAGRAAGCFERADNWYRSAQFDSALVALNNCTPEDSTDNSRVEILHGAIYASRYFSFGDAADKSEAEVHFAKAVRLDPFAAVTEGEYPGQVEGLFNVKRAELLPGELIEIPAEVRRDDSERQALRAFLEKYATQQALDKEPAPEVLKSRIYNTPEAFITWSRTNRPADPKETTIQFIVNGDSIAQVLADGGVLIFKDKQPSVLVSCEEVVEGGSNGKLLETALIDYFTRQGFRVFDETQFESLADIEDFDQRLRDEAELGFRVATDFGIDILLSGTATGSANTVEAAGAKIQTGVASAQLRLSWIATGKQIAATSLDTTVTAFGKSSEAAGRSALQSLSGPLAEELAAACILDWNDASLNGRDLQFVINNVRSSDLQPLRDQLRILTQARGIGEPELQSSSSGKGQMRIYIQTRLAPGDLVGLIERSMVGYSVRVRSSTLARIEIDVL